MEALVALLEKDEYMTGIDLKELTNLARMIEQQYASTLPVVDSYSTATGFYGAFSGFKPKILEAVESFDVDAMDIIASLGIARVIAGQEDQNNREQLQILQIKRN